MEEKEPLTEETKPALALVEPATQQAHPEVVTPKPERQQVLLALVARITEIQNSFRIASLELNSTMFMSMAESQLIPGEWNFLTDSCTFVRATKAEAEPK